MLLILLRPGVSYRSKKTHWKKKRTDRTVMNSHKFPPHFLTDMKKNCLDNALVPDRSIVTYGKGTIENFGCVVKEYL